MPEPLATGVNDNRSAAATFVGIAAVLGIVWCLGFGGLMAVISDDPPTPTAIGLSGLAFGLVMAAVATPKVAPARLEVGAPLDDEVRHRLKLVASEHGLAVKREADDGIEFEPRRAPTFSLGGLSSTLFDPSTAVHATESGFVIIGPKSVITILHDAVTR